MTLTNAQYVVNPGDTTLAPGASGTVLAPGRDLPRNAVFGTANNYSTNTTNTTPPPPTHPPPPRDRTWR